MRKYNSAEIDFLQARAAERITQVLDALGMDYTERRDYVQSACPIHCGDNPRAWYWAFNSCHWKCTTQHCEAHASTGPSTSVFGLVRGVLARKTGKPCEFQTAAHFVAQVLGLSGAHCDAKTAEDIEIDKAIRDYRKRAKEKAAGKGTLLSDVLAGLKPDTVYYPGRGITPEIIAKYHISYCDDSRKPFYQRAFFPVLDDTGHYVQGWSARSIFEKCEECRTHHHPCASCPADRHDVRFVKWRHSRNFHAERCLYNLWHAKPFIAKAQTAILVEGPGDVWAYEMAGIRIAVAMLGLNVSVIQRKTLQRAGALTLVVTTDNDKSGIESRERFIKELNWYFRLTFITPEGAKDVGELGADGINGQIGPILEEVARTKAFRDAYVVEGGQ